MTSEHKAALAAGREEGRAVRRYLEALHANKPKRGRPRTSESIKRRLEQIDSEMPDADPLHALHLRQERRNLNLELMRGGPTIDIAPIEREFIKVAKGYGRRKGISYSTWREAGVDAAVLKKAGINRGE